MEYIFANLCRFTNVKKQFFINIFRGFNLVRMQTSCQQRPYQENNSFSGFFWLIWFSITDTLYHICWIKYTLTTETAAKRKCHGSRGKITRIKYRARLNKFKVALVQYRVKIFFQKLKFNYVKLAQPRYIHWFNIQGWSLVFQRCLAYTTVSEPTYLLLFFGYFILAEQDHSS